MPIFTGITKHLGGTEKDTPRQQYFYGLVQKNVLVTGANGQLGNELKKMTDRLNLPFKFLFTDMSDLDVTDGDQVADFVRDYRVLYIVNCAAYTAVDKAETDVEKAYLVNEKAVENIAIAAKQEGAKVIHISTDFVFDGLSEIPYTEDIEPHPLSVYGQSKLKGEEALQAVGGEWMIIRTSWLYSEYGNNFVKTMIRLMNERDRLTIVDDQRGVPTYAADLAEMIVHILQYSEETEWKTGIYHFSNKGETTWFGFAEEIKRLAGINRCELVPVKTEEYGAPAPRPAYSVMDLSKICAAFHVEIPGWKEALKRCMGLIK
ncbi:RmlD substrate binding domain [Proteiniphilum saccharofermentans]|uniref:dTDP-4-dehydrorhamnose reductase n=1 Tax=Proteiniphilum saccharofermentans TaxID=1642647 RepID=A0A1R3T2R9_9BACT|nr:dTDP-4-dehydrorhamnose reductase [Proteiniphilum saccharofermentans]SCD20299.1 RmlD substrate binding domain [Proteiniphilum saccharofermentans]